MKTLIEVGNALQEARAARKIKMGQLVDSTGLTAVTLRGLLEGRTDARLSSVFAVAQELGLELMLVPKELASSFSDSAARTAPVESAVDRALREPGAFKLRRMS
jgi:transcriptional regulator with XRE-family HTH domain